MAISTETLVATIKAHIEKGDKAADKSNQHYVAAGERMNELKEREQITWSRVFNLCDLKDSRGYEIKSIADGKKTVKEIQKRKSDSMKKLRSETPPRGGVHYEKPQPPSPAVPVPYSPPDPEPPLIPHDPESDSEEEIRVRGFMWRAAESKRYANFDDLSGLEISSQVIEAASAAADAWSALLSKLKGVHNGQEIETQIHEALPA